jgi:Pyridoxamine 5'-phosphate oxidase
VRWTDLERAEPAFAERVRSRFDAQKHKLIATLRADGSPRLSGIEVTFRDGDVWLGMMPNSWKGSDLRRDPRLALHTSSPDPSDDDPGGWIGDAKLDGRAVEVTDPAEIARFVDAQEQMPPGSFDLFRVEIDRVVTVRVGEPADHLEIETWTPERGLWQTKRT